MKKQEKFIDIILMEPELKFNRNKIEKSDPTLIINFLVAILNFHTLIETMALNNSIYTIVYRGIIFSK